MPGYVTTRFGRSPLLANPSLSAWRAARRKVLEAQVRALRAAAPGPRCASCGTPGVLVVAAYRAGRISGCCSGVVTPCGLCGSATCPGHQAGGQA